MEPLVGYDRTKDALNINALCPLSNRQKLTVDLMSSMRFVSDLGDRIKAVSVRFRNLKVIKTRETIFLVNGFI